MTGERVLVLDGEQRASLAVVRSLVRSGFSVTVTAGSPWAIAAASRGVAYVALPVLPLHSPLEYARHVGRIAAELRVAAVIPVTDDSVTAILRHRSELPASAVVPLAPLSTYLAASDKVRVHLEAERAGIGIAETRIVPAAGEDAPGDLGLYPGVVKPHRSVVEAGGRLQRTQVQLVRDQAECRSVLRALPAEAFPVLVQRRVRGPGVGVFVGRWQGQTFARFAHRRLREMPPSGGNSVLSESVELAPALQSATDRMLDALEWDGVAMIECKEDLDRGGWRVMEINGRFWGSLQLAIDCGVDFPSLLVRRVLEPGAPPSVPNWSVGRRLRWEWGDIDHLLVRLLRSKDRLRLDAAAPGRLGAIAAFLAHRPSRDRFELLRADDPKPALAELLGRIARTLHRKKTSAP